MAAAIHVERDRDGLYEAVLWLFEESLAMQRIKPVLDKAGEAPEAADRALADFPAREFSPGYYARAIYLIELSSAVKHGVRYHADELSQSDVVGLGLVEDARREYERKHPACPACGERQDSIGLKQCAFCAAKFRTPGDN